MDMKVKAMIKLIEEDADSFAKRAEMYYKKRPELMKLVEEFYRAYRALAERYDHATGALRQAHRTMTEAFPNQIASLLPDDSPSTSGIEAGPHTPEMPSPMQALLDLDDLQKDALGVSSNFHAISRIGGYSEENDAFSSKRGLKQLNEMFAGGEGASRAKLSEGKARKGLNFLDEEGKDSESKSVAQLLEEASKLSTENKNLRSQLALESEQAQNLKETLSKLESEKELSIKRIADLETQISSTRDELKKLNNAEERCLELDKANQSLQLEMEVIEKKAKMQQKELEQMRSQSHEEAKLLALVIESGVEKLKDSERNKLYIEEEMNRLKEVNRKLNEQTMSLVLNMNNLQDEMISLVEIKERLEEEKESYQQELYGLEEDKNELEQKIQDLTEQRDALAVNMEEVLEKNAVFENSLSDADVELEGLREKAKMLEDSNESLHDEVSTHIMEKALMDSEIEKVYQDMEKLSVKNTLLENSLSDVNVEQENLRTKLKILEESCQSLSDQNSRLVAEKDTLISQVQKVRESLENLEIKYSDLEVRHLNVEREKDSTVCQVMELEHCLTLQKQEHEAVILSKKSQLSTLENQINLLREEIQVKEEEFEAEQQKSMNSLLENFILQRCLCDMKDKNLILSSECQSLNDVNADLEGMRVKVKDLEESCQFLYYQNSSLLAEKNALVSQVQTIRRRLETIESMYSELEGKHSNLEKVKDSNAHQITELELSLRLEKQKHEALIFSNKNLLSSLESKINLLQEESRVKEEVFEVEQHRVMNCQLEIFILQRSLCDSKDENLNLARECQSLYVTNAELEVLRLKLKDLQESCHSLYDQNSTLLAEKNTLISQVESIRQSLENLDGRYSELEDKHLNLQKEKDSTVHQVIELERFFSLEKEEHGALMLSNKNQLASLENQIHLLQEEIQVKEEDFEVEQQKSGNSCLENFILQRCLCDMNEKILHLSRECQRHLESSRSLERQISQCEQKELIQNEQMALLSEHNEKLREGIILLLKILNINKDFGTTGGIDDEILLQTISGKIKNLMNCFSDAENENQHIHLEISVLVTLLNQIGLEKTLLYQEVQCRTEEVSALKTKKYELMEMNEQLRVEKEIHSEQFSDLHEAYQRSETEICKLFEENRSLLKKFYDSRENTEALKEENFEVLLAAMTLEHLYLFFRSLSAERALESKVFSDDMGCLLTAKNDLDEKMKVLEVENICLADSVVYLEECRSSLTVLQIDLNLQIEIGNNFLFQKEMELSEAEDKNIELSRRLEGLNKELDWVKGETEELDKKISAKDKEFDRFNIEVEVLRTREEHLTYEMKKGINEIDQCEREIITLLNDLQFSTLNSAVLEEKVLELVVACESLEVRAMVQTEMLSKEIMLRNSCVDELKNKLNDLDGENRAMKADLNVSLPLVMSLWDGIKSLESHSLSLTRLHEKQDDDSLVSYPNEKNNDEPSQDTATPKPGILKLSKLVTKVEALQKVILDTKSLLEQERLDSSATLDAARKEIEVLKSREISGQEILRERCGQTVKDIQLDQISSSLPYGPNRIETNEPDDQMLELWETAERDDIEVVEEEKSNYPSSELVAEKELSVDKIEVSNEVKETPQEWKQRVTESLSSDAQRLSVLQTSLQELKTKVENKHPKSFESNTVNIQLREAEEAILEQVDIIGKLKHKAEDHSEPSEHATGGNEETRSKERRKISERARKGSEKVSRLELELQKIQYILVRIEEDGKKRDGGGDKRSGVLLRDFLYGRRDVKGRRKGPFCGCIRPKTEA